MIIINGHIRTDPALVHDLAADLRAGIERTRKEDGCLLYTFALDDAEAGTIIAMERWRDQAALDAHLAMPEVAALIARWDGRFHSEVRLFDATNERDLGQ